MPMFNYNNVDNIQICMDVPFVDHPYLIGPRGRKCQHLMDRYRSLVHFPDSNRRQNGPKLNNVVIHGSSKNVEELRFQIRSRTPIRLAVLLQGVPYAAALCSRIEAAIVDRSLPIRFNYTENFGNAMLKTEWRNEAVLIKFCDEFFSRDVTTDAGLDPSTTGGGGASSADLFTMALTVLPVLNPWNAELSRRLIDHIYQATGARVFYPPAEMFADQPPSYFIKASDVASVLQAGKYLLGLTMFQVSFIVPSNVQLNLQETLDWQRDLLVHTAVEPVFSNSNDNGGKTEFLHNRAVLRSFEFCLNSVYFVRSLLLGFKKTVQSSHYNFMTDVKHMIPYSIFSEGQLYFPLYTIDDDRSFDFGTTGNEFFRKFYGGPYSLQTAREQKEHERSSFYGSSLDQSSILYHNNSSIGSLTIGGGGYGAMTNTATPNDCSLADSLSLMSLMAAGIPSLPPTGATAWNPSAASGGYLYGNEDSVGNYGFYGASTNHNGIVSGNQDYYATMSSGPTMTPSNTWNTAVINHISYYNQHNNVGLEDGNGGYGFYDMNNNVHGAMINGGSDYYAAVMSGDCQTRNGPIDAHIYEDPATAIDVIVAPSSKRKSASF